MVKGFSSPTYRMSRKKMLERKIQPVQAANKCICISVCGTLSKSLPLCEGNPPFTGTLMFSVLFRLEKLLNKSSNCQWLEMSERSCAFTVMVFLKLQLSTTVTCAYVVCKYQVTEAPRPSLVQIMACRLCGEIWIKTLKTWKVEENWFENIVCKLAALLSGFSVLTVGREAERVSIMTFLDKTVVFGCACRFRLVPLSSLW